MRLKIKWVDGWAHVHGVGPDGRRIRRSLKTQNPRIAEEARASLEARLWRESLYGTEAVVTFEQCALAYAEDGGDTRFLVKISEQLAGKRLKDITPAMIRSAARAAYPDASPATRNRQGITPARAVINYGHEQGWCPMIKVKGFTTERTERRAVGREYLEALRPHLPLRAYALMLFLHQTGRRVGDALSLPADAVRNGAVWIAKTKNGSGAWAVLTEELVDLLSRIEPRHDRLFGYVARSSLYPTLRRACDKAGVPYLGTHQPGRHSFATSLGEGGFSTKEIAEAGGWKTTRLVAEIYQHPNAPQARAAAHFGKKTARSEADPEKIKTKP